MSSFAEDWDDAGNEDDFDPPDGLHLARLRDGGAFTGRNDGKNYVKLEWELLEAPDAGRRFEDFKGISNKIGLKITREKLELLGLQSDKIEKTIDGLNSAIETLIGTEATISVTHDGAWRNVSVIMVKTGESDVPGDFDTSTGPAAADDDEKAPF